MEKVIFLDRDGTIVKDKVGDLEFLPRAIDGLLAMQKLGAKLVVVTNQAGIAKSFYREQDFFIFTEKMTEQLKNAGVVIAKTYHCPHHPDITGDCGCRKPKPGMVLEAMKELKIDHITISQAVFVGDKDCDIDLGKHFKARTVLIDNGQYGVNSIPSAIAKDLVQAADLISRWYPFNT